MQTSPICDSGKEDHLRISNKINLHGLLALITGQARASGDSSSHGNQVCV